MASGSIKVVIARPTRNLYTFVYGVLKEMSQISQLREQSRIHVVHKWLLGKSTVQNCSNPHFKQRWLPKKWVFSTAAASQSLNTAILKIVMLRRLRKQQEAIVGSTWALEHFARVCTFTLAACDTTSHNGLLKMPHPRLQFINGKKRTMMKN